MVTRENLIELFKAKQVATTEEVSRALLIPSPSHRARTITLRAKIAGLEVQRIGKNAWVLADSGSLSHTGEK